MTYSQAGLSFRPITESEMVALEDIVGVTSTSRNSPSHDTSVSLAPSTQVSNQPSFESGGYNRSSSLQMEQAQTLFPFTAPKTASVPSVNPGFTIT